jgi:hypothetical protein
MVVSAFATSLFAFADYCLVTVALATVAPPDFPMGVDCYYRQRFPRMEDQNGVCHGPVQHPWRPRKHALLIADVTENLSA